MYRVFLLSLLTLVVSNFFGFCGHAAEPQPEFAAEMPAFDFRTQCGSAQAGGFRVWGKGPDAKAFVEGQSALMLQRRAWEQAGAQAAITCPPPAIVQQASSCYGLTTSSRTCYGTTTRSCCGSSSSCSCRSSVGNTPTGLVPQTPPHGRAWWCNCPNHIARVGVTNWWLYPCQCAGTGCTRCTMCSR